MLSKKQYIYTLAMAIVVFGIAFLITYCYTKGNSWDIETNKKSQQYAEAYLIEEEVPVCIMPQTKIILKNQSYKNKYSSETKLETKSLLGLTKEELAKRFENYTIETFSEKEVILVKDIESQDLPVDDVVTYVLGVEDQYVCIKEKDSNKRSVKINYEVTHFSKYIYSLLLNEEIEITSAQKEALLLNPSTLQHILQGYVGE